MARPAAEPTARPVEAALGAACATGAFLAWGVLPLYFKALATVPAAQILAHRIVWSVAFLAVLLTVSRGWRAVDPRILRGTGRTFAATMVLLSFNWLLYIWAVNSGNVLLASLGYFITPLVNVALGVVFLGESLTVAQKVAIGLASLGVAVQVVEAGWGLWISLPLAISFGIYGLLRKRLRVDAVPALFVETLLMSPFAVGWLLVASSRGTGAFGAGAATDVLLVGTGVITTVPLLGFAMGARRLRLVTLGLLQYLSPTCQFLLAILVFDEPFTRTHGATFALIWAALLVYSVDAGLRARNAALVR